MKAKNRIYKKFSGIICTVLFAFVVPACQCGQTVPEDICKDTPCENGKCVVATVEGQDFPVCLCNEGYKADDEKNVCYKPCTVDKDCPEGELCKEKRCTKVECAVDDNCSKDEICNEHKCVKQECTKDADCDSGKVCKDRRCADKEEKQDCSSDSDCGTNEKCESGKCVEKKYPCKDDGDCYKDEICKAGYCTKMQSECVTDRDCSDNKKCQEGVCVGCVTDSDCGASMLCKNGQCEKQDCLKLAPDCGCRDGWKMLCLKDKKEVGRAASWSKTADGFPADTCIPYGPDWAQECQNTPVSQHHCICNNNGVVQAVWQSGDSTSTYDEQTASSMSHCTDPKIKAGMVNKVLKLDQSGCTGG